MCRSSFFCFLLLSFSLLDAEPLLGAGDSEQTKTVRKPNILFAFADDWGRYASVYADPTHPSPNDIIKTPNFDRVAHEGTLLFGDN